MELTIAPPDHGLPLVRQVGGEPVIAGVGSGVEDALCPGCGESVLLASVAPASVYDLAIECSLCGTVAKTASLAPGEGLGGAVLVVPACGVRAGTTFVADCDQIVVGEPGAERRHGETGVHPTSPTRVELDVDGIASVLASAREAFAPIVADIEQRFKLAPNRHRLAHLLYAVDRNLCACRAGSREVDVLAAVELADIASLFDRWFRDPNHARLVQECRDPNTFCHNLVLLRVASLLADVQLGAELVPPDPVSEARRSDMRIRLSARRWVEVDVKTPTTLQRLEGVQVPTKSAAGVVASAVRSSRGQFVGPGILVIGGAFWSGDMDGHAAAASRVLAGPLAQDASSDAHEHHASLLGIVLVSTDIGYARTRGEGEFAGNWNEVDFSTNARHRWIPNPGYALDLDFSFAADMSTFDVSFRP